VNPLLRLLPAPVIRAAGRLQFKYPLLSKPINFAGKLLASKGVIQRGPGKGLRFDGTGCSPGYVAGTSEPLEQSLLSKYLTPGAVFYDVGANAGFYALIGAKIVGPTGLVYAFEPMPELANRVRRNALLNLMDNVMVVEGAVSNTDGTVSFGAQGSLSMLNSIRAADGGANQIAVRSLKLDTFCGENKPPSLVLIDIEGDEIQALEGALSTIENHRPILMVEVHYLGRLFIDFYEHHLSPLGYRASTYGGLPLKAEPIRYHALLLPRERT
jgi:FkbM family methyltransferase